MMSEAHTKAKDAEQVYRLYRSDPGAGVSNYLRNHYRRGRRAIREPSRKARLAHAAWRAGRDRAQSDRMRKIAIMILLLCIAIGLAVVPVLLSFDHLRLWFCLAALPVGEMIRRWND
jgi:hypothetical protein